MQLSITPLRLLACAALCAAAFSGAALANTSHTTHQHRYLIQRSFAKGALDGLNAGAKARVNANNARYGVTWLLSFANSDRTKTFCLYEGPNEVAIRQAAQANHLPVESITEVPVTLQSH